MRRPLMREVAPAEAVSPAPSKRSLFAWLALGLAVVAGLVYVTGSVLSMLFAAGVLAWLLDPLVRRIERYGLSRENSVFVVGGGLFVVSVLIVVAVVPNVVGQFAELAGNMQPYVARLSTEVGPFVSRVEAQFGVHVPIDLAELGRLAPEYLRKVSPDLRAKLQEWLQTAASGGLSLLLSLLSLSLLPLFTFYLLRDWPKLLATVEDLFPVPSRPVVHRLATEIDARLQGFVRGQLTVAFVLGLIYTAGLLISGIDLAVTVGMLGGAAFLVPYLGPIVTGVLAGVLALMKFGLDWHLGAVVATFAIGQFLEGTVLTPWLVGDRVGLHPMVVMVALIVGGNLLGIWGLVLAVPIMAAIDVVFIYVLERWRESQTFRG